MLDAYRIHPWEMGRWTGREIKDLARFHQAKLQEQAQREAQEGG